jgi:hypothetical protein
MDQDFSREKSSKLGGTRVLPTSVYPEVRYQNTPMKIYHVVLLGTWCFIAGCGKSAAIKQQKYNQQHAQENLEQFKQAFAHLDMAVQAGMTFSNASAILKVPPVIMKHDDGTFEADFVYMPRSLDYATYNWLTNGFTLHVSNDIVIHKGYSYSSKR